MNTKDFLRLGVPLGEATRRATDFVAKFILGGGDKSRLREEVVAIVANPSAFLADDLRKDFAKALLNATPRNKWLSPLQPSSGLQPPSPAPAGEGTRAEPVKYHQWGEGLDHEAVMQMEKACLLPVSVAGALMPDAHVGYGLPIGGALATENAVIPYAVGVDIACRMKMTVLDIPVRDLEQKADRLTCAIEAETRFGVGASFRERRQHDVLDTDWSVSPITKQNKDKAWSQLGTSGSGNHFVEFGLFTAHSKINELEAGNHHNFAWKERHVIGGVEREVIVHRKGATPAGAGVLGIIPGSMATPGFVVSGKGHAESLNSASHGAGRAMSRKAANEKFNWKDVNRFLKQQGVTLISAGLDEVPMAYKNIRDVMSAQKDLVTVLGEFMPKLVKMAPSGERPED